MLDETRGARYERCKPYMEQQGLDVLVAISPENVLYFAETYIQTQTSIRERLAITVMPLASEPAIIACKIEEPTVEAETWISDRRYFVELQCSPIAMLADVIKEKHLENRRIGIELNYLMATYYQELITLLPNAEFVQCARIFDQVRAIKELREIKQLSYAGLNTVRAMEAAVRMSRVGDSENDLAVRIIKNMFDNGCQAIEFMCLGSGRRSEMAHCSPSPDVRLEDGSVIHIDYGGRFNHYNSDIARGILIGKPNEKHLDVYKRLTNCYVRGIEQLRPGARACDIYQFTKEQFEKEKIPFTMSLVGHGLGIGVHELPMLVPSETKGLEEDMMLCYELRTIVDGHRYHIEDLIHITEKGCEVLSQPKLDTTMPWIQPDLV